MPDRVPLCVLAAGATDAVGDWIRFLDVGYPFGVRIYYL